MQKGHLVGQCHQQTRNITQEENEVFECLARDLKVPLQKSVILGHIKAEHCDIMKSILRVQAHLKWREALMMSGGNDWKVEEFLPNRLYKQRFWIIKMGEVKIGEVLCQVTQEEVCGYIMRKVDSIVMQDQQVELILDMKGISLKTLTTHSFMNIISTLANDLLSNYPDCLKSIYMLSTPLFVPGLLDSNLKPQLPAETFAKFILTGESMHPDLPFDLMSASDDNSFDQEISDNDEGNIEYEEEIDEGVKMSSNQIGQVMGEIGGKRRLL